MNNDNQQWRNLQNFIKKYKASNQILNKNDNSKQNKNSNKCNKVCCLSNNNDNNKNTPITRNNNNNYKHFEKRQTPIPILTSPSSLLPPPLAATISNECDKRNFDSITTNSKNHMCSSNYDSNFDSIFLVVPEISSANRLIELNKIKRRHYRTRVKFAKYSKNKEFSIPRRTFYSRDAFLFRSGFYRILLLCLQLSTVLFSFSLNISFALAANSFGEISNSLSSRSSSSSSGSGEFGDDSNYGHYTHTWAVHIPHGDKDNLAETVAREHGFVNLGKIFDEHFHFAHHKVSKRSLSASEEHQTRLDEDSRVHWSKQQRVKSRQKRDFMRGRLLRTSPRTQSLVDAVLLNDPKWSQMWYLNRGGGLDMNVIPAWKEGITGKGIVVTILDDGLESDHPDIEHNYDPMASYDVNSHDNDPMPHYDMTDSNRHGTRCAGEVAATANNSICAVGIAFGASVGGVRMLDGDVTDAVEARSLSLNPQHIDIYSASWGPDDDGKTVDGPGELASRAFIEGVTKGRGGKGSIFIWASGNGGRELDNCNCDGYTNSIWTLSISSATEDGHVPWYSEKCSSTLATTYSSGSQGEKQVVTTDLHHSCTASHTGTSASAPLAAGIAALVLESNNNLTWRDLQHIVVRTAKPANLKDPTWTKNGVGRRISHSFGYGLMDAAAMVRIARTWKTVPEQQRCEINAPHVDKTIPAEGYITLQLAVKHCMSVNYLEHVQAKITLTSQRRGDIKLFLRSPAGTKVTLLTNRQHDNSRIGFNQWPFMSVHTWGESPHGNWQLEIHNEGRFKGHALLREWSLIFYGTTQPIDPNDPISTRRLVSTEITTPNSSSTISSSGSPTTTLHQIYSPLYPRISPNNMAMSNGLAKYPAKLPPSKSTYILNTNNSPINSGNSNSNSKKQQQQGYQQISATYGVILGSQTKNTKGTNAGGSSSSSSSSSGSGKGKGKSGENKKNSNKGNNNNGGGKSVTTNVSNKKNQSVISSPSAQKIKFYRILQELQSNSNSNSNINSNSSNNNKSKLKSTSNRPIKHQSIERMQLQHSSEEKANRKVIGDLPHSSSTHPKIPLRATVTATTTTQTSSGGYTKLPVKSTKQIKEKPQLQQTHEKLLAEPVPVVGNIPDQRIPKMFERYDKIQAIFPEFQPYQNTKEQDYAMLKQNNDTNQRQAQKYKQAQTAERAPMVLPASSGSNTGSKPSRENPKKSSQSFVPDPLIIKKQQELLQAAAAASSNSALREEISAENENENAQITQWDLIFYGTEEPAQSSDAVHLSSGKYNSFGSDMEHNDIEFDASGQWHNMQQVGESVVKSHDRTNTACTKSTIDQRCLACAPPTYLFNGHCYDECPIHTYVVINELEPSEAHIEISDNATNKLSEIEEPLESMDKRRKRQRRKLTATNPTSPINEEIQTRQCHICDSSCYKCYGPLNSQCSTCYPGGQLRKFGNETFCYNFAERSTKNANAANGENSNLNYFDEKQMGISLKLMLSATIFIVSIVFIIIFITFRAKICQRFNHTNTCKVQYAYDRVALLTETETDIQATTTVNRNVAQQSSDKTCVSESEEEFVLFNINNEKI